VRCTLRERFLGREDVDDVAAELRLLAQRHATRPGRHRPDSMHTVRAAPGTCPDDPRRRDLARDGVRPAAQRCRGSAGVRAQQRRAVPVARVAGVRSEGSPFERLVADVAAREQVTGLGAIRPCLPAEATALLRLLRGAESGPPGSRHRARSLLLGLGLSGAVPCQDAVERAQAVRDGVHRRRGHHEESEDADQDHQRNAGPDSERADQRGRDEVADDAAALPHGVETAARGGQIGGHVDQSADGEGDRTEPDADPTVCLDAVRVPHQPEGKSDEDERHHDADPAEGPGHDRVDDVTGGAGQSPPLAGPDDHGEAEQSEGQTVPTVRRVELTGTATDPAGGAADNMSAPIQIPRTIRTGSARLRVPARPLRAALRGAPPDPRLSVRGRVAEAGRPGEDVRVAMIMHATGGLRAGAGSAGVCRRQCNP